MTMTERYSNWKCQPFTAQLSNEVKATEIFKIISELNTFFGFVGLQAPEIDAITNWMFDYLERNKLFKLSDMRRAIELYKSKPDLNKLSAFWFESCFEKYRSSDERKEIVRMHNNDNEGRIEEPKKELSASELLKNCFWNYYQTKQINYNTGAVYTLNSKLIVDKLGFELCSQIKNQVKEGFLNSRRMEKDQTTSQIKRVAIDEEIRQATIETGRVQIEWRKAHLKAFFDKHISGEMEIHELPKVRQAENV